MNILLW